MKPLPHSPVKVVEVEVHKTKSVQVRHIRQDVAIASAKTFIMQFGCKERDQNAGQLYSGTSHMALLPLLSF